MPFREIAELIGQRLNVPVISKSPPEAARQFSFMSPFLAVDNPVSSKLTQARLGWNPTQPDLFSDLDQAEYFNA